MKYPGEMRAASRARLAAALCLALSVIQPVAGRAQTAPPAVAAKPAQPLTGDKAKSPEAKPPKPANTARPQAKQSNANAKDAPAQPVAPAAKRRRRRKPKRKRPGGINPCMTPDPGWGVYDRWSRKVSMGQMLAPQLGGLTRNGGFDLIVHFHGHYPIRKEFVKSARGIVLVAIDLGIGSGAYSSGFASPNTFKRLLDSVKTEMARRSGRKRVYVRKLAISSWSAGYGAVAQILKQPAGRKVDALILLDSVHAGYADEASKRIRPQGIAPFTKFARAAARGSKLMFQSHSSIIPPGYASTREVSHFIVKQLGGKIRRARRNDVLGLELFERFDRRGYHVRGYRGDDKPDHCAHLGLIKDVLKVHIQRRWRSPKGRRGKRAVAKSLAVAKKSGVIHTVRRGDHLTGIAKKYGTTVRAVRDANGLQRGRAIQPGQELVIPVTKPSRRGSPKAKAPKHTTVHIVGDGQSLGRIARRYNVTVTAIRELNRLRKSKRIQPGQRLLIPQRLKKKRKKKAQRRP